jgi:hypothetical protein
MILDENIPIVLMLGYKSLSGKDTFYSFAKELGFERVAFADKLKSSVADLYNLTWEQVHGGDKDLEDTRYKNFIDKEELPVEIDLVTGNKMIMWEPNPEFKEFLTPRRILQIYGQQQRSLYKDIWASYVFNVKIPELMKEGHRKFIVTDFRFSNEAKVAEDWNTKNESKLFFIKIDRPQVTAKSNPSDISENDLNNFDKWSFILENNGTLEEYNEKVLNLINTLV